ncbi:MAG: hypothetical protein PHH93_13280, partial [Prolixibacteraceae bacterium]|nr:hypothetical protein [Prolixibacteraceae bacterium]
MNINPQEQITGNKNRINDLRNTIIPVTLLLISLLINYSGAFGQKAVNRAIEYSQYPETYFDSIRLTVYDTAKEYYTVKAYRLSGTQEIVIDGKLDEQAWHNA